MERVSGDGFFSYRREVREKAEDAKRSRRSSRSRSFLSDLENRGVQGPLAAERTPEAVEAEAAELLDAVFEAGDRLKHSQDREALQTYKEAVRKFVTAVVKQAVDITEQTSGSHILRRKRYALVQVIDRKLEQLAAGMVTNQRRQLDLLARIDEINGLIVNLTR